MKWKSSKEPPEKSGEYSCKTSKGRLIVAEKKEDSKFLVAKNPHYLRSNEKIVSWMDEEIPEIPENKNTEQSEPENN